MANIVRFFSESGFYHVYNRGVHCDVLFYEDFDYQYFLQLIGERCSDYGITIIAYCLMRNHYHFLLRLGNNDQGIRHAIERATMSYARYFNKKYQQSGRLFQGPYRSKVVLSDEYLLHLTHYIHANPADFCDPLRYRWSSITAYTNRIAGIANPTYILKMLGKQPYELEERRLPSRAEKR